MENEMYYRRETPRNPRVVAPWRRDDTPFAQPIQF